MPPPLPPPQVPQAGHHPRAISEAIPTSPIFGIGSSSRSDFDVPLVILRVQILSCHNLEAKHRNGYSDPFVVVSILGKEFKTPVCKRNLNPIYKPEDATFEFPIYVSVHQAVKKLGIGTLKFDVKDKIRSNFMGKYELPVDHWFKGTAFAFDDPNNQPFFVGLISSRLSITVRGTMCIKVGFVHPPNSPAKLPEFEKTYNILITFMPAPAEFDPVVELNNYLQSHPTGNQTKEFAWVSKREGPENQVTYLVTAVFMGQNVGQGSGTSMNIAKKEAAVAALKHLNITKHYEAMVVED